MFRLVIGLALTLALAESRSAEFDERIIGGQNANITEFPWQVQLQHSGNFFCGGSILNANWILSAAHCCSGETSTTLTVRAGTSTRGSGGTVFSVSSVYTHEDFDIRTFENDICLVQLLSPITFGTTMGAMTLPTANAGVANNAQMVVTGWGYTTTVTSPPPTLPYILQKVTVNYIDTTTCDNMYDPYADVSGNMICAAAPYKDSCQGDSGGPLVIGSTQHGIVAWGFECADPDYPGVYTRVSHYIGWINDII